MNVEKNILRDDAPAHAGIPIGAGASESRFNVDNSPAALPPAVVES